MRDKNNTRRSGRHVDQCRKWSKILRPKRARSSATSGNQGRKGRLTEDKRKIFRRRQEEEEGKDKQATKENSGSHTGNNHSEERRGKQVRRQVGDTRQQWETEERQGSRQIGNKLGDKRPPKKNGKQAGRQDQKSSFPLRHPFQERKNPNSIVNSLGKRRGSRTQAGKKQEIVHPKVPPSGRQNHDDAACANRLAKAFGVNGAGLLSELQRLRPMATRFASLVSLPCHVVFFPIKMLFVMLMKF